MLISDFEVNMPPKSDDNQKTLFLIFKNLLCQGF